MSMMRANPMTIKDIRSLTGLSQKAFAELLHIPLRSIENWESGKREPPAYVVELIEFRIKKGMTRFE